MDVKRLFISKVVELLEKERFNVSIMEGRVSCFDILAARRSFILLLKFLLNIDGLSEDQAADIKRLSSIFRAYPLIIGEKTRHFQMDDGVLYTRYGLNAITLKTFEDIIVREEYPVTLSSRGGYYVKIDREKLRRVRRERGISLGELAEHIGVSKTMVYAYEHSDQGATLLTVIKLEEYLGEDVTAVPEVFFIPALEEDYAVTVKAHHEPIFTRLEEIGFEIQPIKRAPFDAVTKSEDDSILTKVDRRPERTLREIRLFKEISDLSGRSAFVVAESSDAKESVDGLPVIKLTELGRMETSAELLETLASRC